MSLQPCEHLYAMARIKGLTPEMAAVAAGFDFEKAAEIGETYENLTHIKKFIKETVESEVKDSKIDPLAYLEDMLARPDHEIDPKEKIKIATVLLPYKHKRVSVPASKVTKTQQMKENADKAAEQSPFGQSRPPAIGGKRNLSVVGR